MPRLFVPPEGPADAQLAIVAEKPGRDEVIHLLSHEFRARTMSDINKVLAEVGIKSDEAWRVQQGCNDPNCIADARPLVGASGQAVNRHLQRVGTSRSRTLLLNSVMHFDAIGNPTDDEIKAEQVYLYRTLSEYPNLKCIVAMGNCSLLSLSNFHIDGIMNQRGSILTAATRHRMVPTLHPAFYMRGEWRYRPIVEFDLRRAYELSLQDNYKPPKRTFFIEPTFSEAIDWMGELEKSSTISFDIETFWPHWIACIAFSDDEKRAFCIPIMKTNRQHYWDNVREEGEIWKAIQRVLANPKARYVSQNGLFDCWHLWRHGIETPYMNKGFDTLYAHRLIAPDLPHDLGFLTSIYTEEPYYKDESGNWKQIRVPDRQFWIYNCKDAAVTLEVAKAEQQDMEEADLLEHYIENEQTQFDALLNMRKGGVRVDRQRLAEVRSRLARERRDAVDEVVNLVGWEPNTKSWKDMGKLFDQLRITYTQTPTGRPKSNEERLIAYMHQMSQKGDPTAVRVLALCLEVTKRRTLESNFVDMALDANGFYHPAYYISKAVTGRTASEGADEGGPQLMNVPEPIRVVFVGDDKRCEVTCCDLKQAEAMVVAWEAGDELMIKAFEADKDAHRVLACVVDRGWNSTELPPDELLDDIRIVCDACEKSGQEKCKHSERQRSKVNGHALRYRMGLRKLMMLQAKDGVFLTEAQAEYIRSRVVSPAVKAWHEKVSVQLQQTHKLRNACGRVREFYGIFDEEMIRKGLSWIAQSTVASITTKAMRILDVELPKLGARLMTQTHDSVTVSNLKHRREETDECLRSAFNQPLVIGGRRLLIPVEITHGPSWGEQK